MAAGSSIIANYIVPTCTQAHADTHTHTHTHTLAQRRGKKEATTLTHPATPPLSLSYLYSVFVSP